MSTTAVAYELVDGYDLDTYGGTSHLRDGLHVNIGDALREGKTDANPRGIIVTDDDLLQTTLDGRYDLRRAALPADARITSHQLVFYDQDDPGQPRQHQRDLSGLPAIARERILLPDVSAPPIPDAFPIPQAEAESVAAGGEGDRPPDAPTGDAPTPPPSPSPGPGRPSSAGSGAASPGATPGRGAGAGDTTTSGS